MHCSGNALFFIQVKGSMILLNIPKWDILIIPFWYNVISTFEREDKMNFRLKELRKRDRISQLKCYDN